MGKAHDYRIWAIAYGTALYSLRSRSPCGSPPVGDDRYRKGMGMSEMVERVARAICAAYGDHPDAIGEPPNDEGIAVVSHAFPRWMSYRTQAHAAIAAMREPTEAMEDAGCRIDFIVFGQWVNTPSKWMRRQYQAMIEEAGK